jgi:hypothetical protein
MALVAWWFAEIVDMVLNKSFELDGRRVDVKMASVRDRMNPSGAAGAPRSAPSQPPPSSAAAPPPSGGGAGASAGGGGGGAGSGERTRKMFVGGLSLDTTTEEFRAYFERFGEVEEALIMARAACLLVGSPSALLSFVICALNAVRSFCNRPIT